jgi:hypothetical protein
MTSLCAKRTAGSGHPYPGKEWARFKSSKPQTQGKMKRLFIALAIGLVAGGLGLAYGTVHTAAIDEASCLSCHGDYRLNKVTEQEGKTSLYVDEEALESSVHGSLDCTTCHTTFDPNSMLHSASNITPLTELSLVAKCGSCHEDQYLPYLDSTHGTELVDGNNDVASCPDCHSLGGDAHSIVGVLEPDSPVYKKNVDETCATCHDDEGLMATYDISATVYENYINSVHSQTQQLDIDQVATCTSCHGSHDITSVEGFTESTAAKCGSCHDGQYLPYLGSVHGEGLVEGNTDVPNCASCHSPEGDAHGIIGVSEPDSLVLRKSIAQTCATCHDDEGLTAEYDISTTVYETYNNFFHGKAMSLATDEQIADMQYATCTSCHGSHDIMNSENPGSPVASLENLAETCGQCHDGASIAFASSYHMHQEASTEHQLPTFIANVFYSYFLIPAMVVFGTSFILLDLLRSLRQRRRWRKTGRE